MTKTRIVYTQRKPGRPTPLKAAEQLGELAATLAALGVPAHHLNPAARALQEYFEGLPVRWDAVDEGRWVFHFVLAGDEWWPASAGEEISGGPCAGGVTYRIDYKDGSVESGVARRYHWAHCTADDTVNYHWLDPVEPPEDVPEDPSDGETPPVSPSAT